MLRLRCRREGECPVSAKSRRHPLRARHALNLEELAFCRVYSALGETNAAEAYRRSFLAEVPEDEHPPAKEISRRAKQLAERDHIRRYLDELNLSASEHARTTLEEQAKLGVGREAASAAAKILDQEDKLGLRDATLQWAAILVEAGADVVVPLPGRFQRDVVCRHCGETTHVDEPLEVSFDLGEMFSQYAPEEPP